MNNDIFVLDFYTRHNQGFGHSLMSFCRAIEFARANKMQFTIDDRRWFLGTWSEYFIYNFPDIESLDQSRFYRKHIGQKQFDEAAYSRFKRLDVEIKHSEEYNYFTNLNILSILKEIYRYNSDFGQKVSRACESFEFENLIAFHIRLGDKIPQHKMNLDDHLKLIFQLIDKYNLGDCEFFLMTDDLSIHPAVSNALGKPVLYRSTTTTESKMLRFQKGHLGDLLIEIEIAMRSKQFFSSVSDTSRLVRAYRAMHGKSSNIEHLPI